MGIIMIPSLETDNYVFNLNNTHESPLSMHVIYHRKSSDIIAGQICVIDNSIMKKQKSEVGIRVCGIVFFFCQVN